MLNFKLFNVDVDVNVVVDGDGVVDVAFGGDVEM